MATVPVNALHATMGSWHIRDAPMRIGTEDPWALTELAKAGGLGGLRGTPV